jgi:aspartate kinase
MKVYKFGGASIKDAKAIKNMGGIVLKYGTRPLLIVVSAMGKTTRALEGVFEVLIHQNDPASSIDAIQNYHLEILSTLFEKGQPIYEQIETYFIDLRSVSINVSKPDQTYDRIVSFGELISSAIVSAYLGTLDLKVYLAYSPELIRTSSDHRSGRVDLEVTQQLIREHLINPLEDSLVVAQGYIGGDSNGHVVTLGKEGSDYSAAIYASCLNAESVTIWKDVAGVLNGDPKKVASTKQMFELPYKEASEMTFYGASVIHPKTIKPLANQHIPLIVRSFDHPEFAPTVISDFEQIKILPSVIHRSNQCLFSFGIKDLSFINRQHLSTIFKTLDELNISIHMMQNSAVSVSICFDSSESKLQALLNSLSDQFYLHYNLNLEMITIKNYDDEAITRHKPVDKHILMEQRTRANYRFLVESDTDG